MENPKKRKAPSTTGSHNGSKRDPKRARTLQARSIPAQSSEKALNERGELNVAAFVKSREFEIRALERSMRATKSASSTRAFQAVPKDMRRRTASHNVKKVPKRMRARAAKEMKEDNTPTVTARRRKPTPHQRLRLEKAKELKKKNALPKKTKRAALSAEGTQELSQQEPAKQNPNAPKPKKNTLSKPAKQPPRFRKRQINKSWLPTHVWHAKRAHMTEPLWPLWRFAIPISPTDKVYRPTHRAGSMTGCVAWDTSYMGTIAAEGVEASLLGLLKSFGIDDEGFLQSARGRKWRQGSRSWSGWVRERDNDRRWIAPVTVIWCAEEGEQHREASHRGASEDVKGNKKPRRKLFLRVHPSAFLEVWKEILKNAKIQRPPVMVEDLRFEIGSIEITGPGAMEALVGVLHPSSRVSSGEQADGVPDAQNKEQTDAGESHSAIFTRLASLTNPSSLPMGALLNFDIDDPRLYHPPRTLHVETPDMLQFQSLLSEWPADARTTSCPLFSHITRHTASRLPSQKSINRRKGEAPPGEFAAVLESDPIIPTMLLASRSPSKGPSANRGQGSWTLLLPWSCVLPVWYSLVHYPLSTGGNPRFGGLNETQEIAMDRQSAWFPGDFPGTSAGWAWEMREREKLEKQWRRKPKGKRCEFDTLDLGTGVKGEIGVGWGCDWERLFSGDPGTDGMPADKSSANEDETSSAKEQRPSKEVQESEQESSSTRKNDEEKPASTKTPTGKPANPTTTLEPDDHPSPAPPFKIHHVPFPFPTVASEIPSTGLSPISITLVSTGHLSRNARIYRLPTASSELRSCWLALDNASGTSNSGLHHRRDEATRQGDPFAATAAAVTAAEHDSSSYDRLKHASHLAHSLLFSGAAPPHRPPPPEVPKPNDPSYPPVPSEKDLIGFVTSANYNLARGHFTAIGNIAISRVIDPPRHTTNDGGEGDVTGTREEETMSESKQAKQARTRQENARHRHYCIVRNSGDKIGRLARWAWLSSSSSS